MNPITAAQHRGTEKNNISVSCHVNSVHLFGKCKDGNNNLFFLGVLSASVVQLLFPG